MASYSSTSARLQKTCIKKDGKQSLDLNRPAVEQRGFGVYQSDSRNASRSAQDVTFASTRRGYHHTRSTSGASQTGSFVHPFQQPPSDSKPHRPYTPPSNHQPHHGSLISSEYSTLAVPEEGEQHQQQQLQYRNNTIRSASTLSEYAINPAVAPPLRIQTKVGSFSRLPHGNSQSNLHSTISLRSSDVTSPSETMSPASVVRSSMDKGFRIRSRSEVDPHMQQESIRDLRRKFDERERIKEEKAAREEVRLREKQNLKEARMYEKNTRKSTGSETGTRSKRSRSDLTSLGEKGEVFIGRDYNSVAIQTPPVTVPQTSDLPRRNRMGASGTKKKTHSAWTSFVMWLRTRLLRMSKSSGDR